MLRRSASMQGGRLASAADPQFAQQAVDMVLHRRDLDAQCTGDHLVGLAPLDQVEDFPLAPGQLHAGLRAGLRLAPSPQPPNMAKEHMRHLGLATQGTRPRIVNGTGEIGQGCVPRHEPPRPGLCAFENLATVPVDTHGDQGCLRCSPGQGRHEIGGFTYLKVDKRDIGGRPPNGPQSLL